MIDPNFNFHSDAKGGDPDRTSPTLKKYHQLLWSKILPNGDYFKLEDNQPYHYLYYKSEEAVYALGSDTITHSYRSHTKKKWLTEQIPYEVNDLFISAGNIASYILFPKNKVRGNHTINQSRGVNRFIDDRFDLTLECIRRYYLNQTSPLYSTLKRYEDFFKLFEDFRGYIDFFFLQDLYDENSQTILFYLPFDDFKMPPSFKSVEDYLIYKKGVLDFVNKRKDRIVEYAKSRML